MSGQEKLSLQSGHHFAHLTALPGLLFPTAARSLHAQQQRLSVVA
jgi:hypothetical protein